MDTLDLTDMTILLVEDVAFNRRLITQLLHGLGRPNIFEAADGREALDILSSQETYIEFVVSDFNMPRFDGLQLLKSVRTGERGIDRGIPFSMLTAHSDVELVEGALALDVNGFLIKPVSKGALEQRLRQMLAQSVDTSWLRSVEEYANIDVKTKVKLAPLMVEPQRGAAGRGVVSIDKDELLSGAVGEVAARAGRRRRPGSSGKKAPQRRKLDPIRLPSFDEEPEEKDVSRQVEDAMDELVSETGGQVAGRVISSLDGFVKKGVLALDRLPDMLQRDEEAEDDKFYEELGAEWDGILDDINPQPAPSKNPSKPATGRVPGRLPASTPPLPPELPASDRDPLDVTNLAEGSISETDIYTTEGDLIIAKGTEMTPRLLALVHKLDGLDALTQTQPSTQNDDIGNDAEPDSEDVPTEVLCPFSEITEGALLARDITTSNGNLLLAKEEEITGKRLSMLEVAHDLGHIANQVWVKT